jgi:hypothetical protein
VSRLPVISALGVAACLAVSPHTAARAVPSGATVSSPADSAPFTVSVDETPLPHSLSSVFVLPGDLLTIDVAGQTEDSRVGVEGSRGTLSQIGRHTWKWEAPSEPGLYSLHLWRDHPRHEVELNAFVMVPFGDLRGGVLNGYRIDDYPATPLDGLLAYEAPNGFVEVTADTAEARLSSHFRLGQFLCKQPGGFPKYVVVQPTLLMKLEAVLEAVNDTGYPTDSLYVMSGYRTPFYNRAIGNTANSRHVYGDAADIFVDVEPRDGRMDDLDGNGRVDVADNDVLIELVEGLEQRAPLQSLIGGLAPYRATPAHGPFVHVDARGHRARW